ncbi:MAG: pilus assembly protein PilZ [Spirochaetaceae bacterium]|jgi:hypothetical protein|nr:pilus assembly protein PilZ [Spirochaetaceae bacterium]
MGMLPRQKLQDYYDEFKSIPITFNKEVIQVTGLQAKQVILKCASDFYPCFVWSTSFEEAKVVASNKSGLIEKLKESNNSVSIKFCFKQPAGGEQVAFLVTTRMIGFAPYAGGADMSMFTLRFSQRPPDDLIEIVGRILEANVSFSKRKNERIVITPDTLRKLRFSDKAVGVAVEGVPRRCLVRDISFNGARLAMVGISKFLIGKQAVIKFNFDEPAENYDISGKIQNVENIADRGDMVLVNMIYTDTVPMVYKVRLNDYLSTVRPDSRLAPPVSEAAQPVDAAPPQPADDPTAETDSSPG